MSATNANDILSKITISPALKERISIPLTCESCKSTPLRGEDRKFVLYLPTVNLRMEQNPAFALACHLANSLDVPCIVLAVVLDDHNLNACRQNLNSNNKHVVMTSRRLAFILEALSEACRHWSDHGAGCAIRVHGPKCRSPDHLTLSSRAMAVVTDEPFVDPFLTFAQRVEKTCSISSVPFFRVDGSTTVPPVSILKRKNSSDFSQNENVYFTGVPSKAWKWQKISEPFRKKHLNAAMNGEFDAPDLTNRIVNVDFFMDCNSDEDCSISTTVFPLMWRDRSSNAPGSRPWTVMELADMADNHRIKEWSLAWPGADPAVPPCMQTVGTTKKGMMRWNTFVRDRKGLAYYAGKRTNPLQPHGSSRMSCYLNFGIVSIFKLVHEVKLAQASKVPGADKFEEEIVKWREMSYAHAFSRGDYDRKESVPLWAIKWITEKVSSSVNDSFNKFDTEILESGTTDSEIWNAMQGYLVRTGELHNNVRMTWGKQIVAWGLKSDHRGDPTEEILRVLVYLNDRYALDGLSPPSYAGLLWCVGWCDGPDAKGGIRMKHAASYKLGSTAFKEAEENLLREQHQTEKRLGQLSIISSFQKQNKKRKEHPTIADETG